MRRAGKEGATERSAYLAKLLVPVLLLVFMTAALAGSPRALAAKKGADRAALRAC